MTSSDARLRCPPQNYPTRTQLVEDSGGFKTFAAKSPGSGALSLRGETVVDEHIGRLYTAFLNTTSTLDWVRFLVEVEELPPVSSRGRSGASGGGGGGDGGVLFQRYDMPWPVKDREVLLRRNVRLDKRAKKMIATCETRFTGHATQRARAAGRLCIRRIRQCAARLEIRVPRADEGGGGL